MKGPRCNTHQRGCCSPAQEPAARRHLNRAPDHALGCALRLAAVHAQGGGPEAAAGCQHVRQTLQLEGGRHANVVECA